MVFPIYTSKRFYTDLPSGYPICTSVSYNANGDFIPVAFGIEIGEQRYRYKIHAIKSYKDYHNIRTFECIYTAFGQYRTVFLRFDINRCCWYAG